MESTETKPTCKLTGTDGNVFSIISKVKRALDRAGLRERGSEFQQRAMTSESYDAVLRLCFEYVDVE